MVGGKSHLQDQKNKKGNLSRTEKLSPFFSNRFKILAALSDSLDAAFCSLLSSIARFLQVDFEGIPGLVPRGQVPIGEDKRRGGIIGLFPRLVFKKRCSTVSTGRGSL